MFYGVVSLAHLRDAAYEISDCIGNGRGLVAPLLLLETCAAETRCGQYRDPTPNGAGRGVTQIDEETFVWLQKKYGTGEIAQRINGRFGIDINRVSHRELDYNPLLALIFARLRYWTVPEAIPSTTAGRAVYWKQHYNTELGKGTTAEYIEKARECLGGTHV